MDQKKSSHIFATPDLDQTIRKMNERLEGFVRENDPRQRFLLMYRTFKKELRRNLRQGRFLDHEWSEAICCRMGGMYFEAVEAYEKNNPSCPDSWRICFDLSLAGKTNLLQDALMGMNAHINYDLSVCVYDVMEEYGDFQKLNARSEHSSLVDRTLNSLLKKRYHDYLLINQIAWESIPEIQKVLTQRFSRLLGILNLASFHYTRSLVEQLILNYRDRAWTHALLLLSSSDKGEYRHILTFTDELAVNNLRLIKKYISYNPLNLVYLAFRPEKIRKGTEINLRPLTADLLKQKMMRRETSKYASQTLAEYGNASLPYLREWLQNQKVGTGSVSQMYRILAKINTTKAAYLLSQILSTERDPSYDLLNAIWQLDTCHIQSHFEDFLLRRITDRYLREYAWTMQLMEDLLDGQDESLLHSSLNDRLNWKRQRLEMMLKIILVNRGLPKEETKLNIPQFYSIIAEVLGEKRTALVQKILQGDTDQLLVEASQLFQIKSKKPNERINEIMKGEDKWLKFCVLKGSYPEQNDQISSEYIEDSTMISTVEKVLHLKNVELFNEIPAEELTSIAQVAEYKSFEQGDFLIRQDQAGKNLHIITNGSVKVIKNGSVVTKLGKGDVLGEMSILTDSYTSADCQASGETKTLQINQKNFLDFLYEGYPEIALGLIKVLAKRLEKTTSDVQSE